MLVLHCCYPVLSRLWTAQRQLNFVPLPEPATASLTSSSKAEQHGTVDSSSNSTVPAQLRWCQLNLPAPLLQASVSAELADRLQLQRLRITKQQQGFPQGQSAAAGAAAGGGALTQQQEVQEVSVARVQALLTHRCDHRAGGGERVWAVKCSWCEVPRRPTIWQRGFDNVAL